LIKKFTEGGDARPFRLVCPSDVYSNGSTKTNFLTFLEE
jgi:phage terminase large subunit-like protein